MQAASFRSAEVEVPVFEKQAERQGLVEIDLQLLPFIVGGSPKGGWSSQEPAGLDAATSSPKGGW
jgi:hypothetical protein